MSFLNKEQSQADADDFLAQRKAYRYCVQKLTQHSDIRDPDCPELPEQESTEEVIRELFSKELHDVEIGKYYFYLTCSACPEQYDVIDTEGKILAYVRLRYGKLKVYVPDVGGELLYQKNYDEDFLGTFPSDQERKDQLEIIAQKLKEYYEAS